MKSDVNPTELYFTRQILFEHSSGNWASVYGNSYETGFISNGTTIFFKGYEIYKGDTFTLRITPDTSRKLRIGPVDYRFYYNPTFYPLHNTSDGFSDWIAHIRTFYNNPVFIRSSYKNLFCKNLCL